MPDGDENSSAVGTAPRLLRAEPPLTVDVADGFLVTYAAGEQRQHELCDDLAHARDSYSEPPMGWRSIGISACKDGVPFAALNVPVIQYVTSNLRGMQCLTP